MKRGMILVSKHVLAAYLNLPQEWEITSAVWKPERDCFEVFVQGKGLPDAVDLCYPQVIRPSCITGVTSNGLYAVRTVWPVEKPRPDEIDE